MKCILHPKVSTNFRLQLGGGEGGGMSKDQTGRPNVNKSKHVTSNNRKVLAYSSLVHLGYHAIMEKAVTWKEGWDWEDFPFEKT